MIQKIVCMQNKVADKPIKNTKGFYIYIRTPSNSPINKNLLYHLPRYCCWWTNLFSYPEFNNPNSCPRHSQILIPNNTGKKMAISRLNAGDLLEVTRKYATLQRTAVIITVIFSRFSSAFLIGGV